MINYTDYITKNLNKQIAYSEYVAEALSNSANYNSLLE